MSNPRPKKDGEFVDEKAAERERQRAESRTNMRRAGAGIVVTPPKQGNETKFSVPERPGQDAVDAFTVHYAKGGKGPSSRAREGAAELAAAKRPPEPGSVATGGTFAEKGKALRQGQVNTNLDPIAPAAKKQSGPGGHR